MKEVVLEIPIKCAGGIEEKVFLKVYVRESFDTGRGVTRVDGPRVLNDKEKEEIGI